MVLENKIDQRELLSLSFYSIGILQHSVMDAVLAKIMHTHYNKKNPSKLTITQFEEQVYNLQQIFRYEYIDI